MYATLRSRFLFALLFLLVTGPFQAQQPAPEQAWAFEKDAFRIMTAQENTSLASADFDVHFYQCDWAIDPAVRYISGAVRTHFTITAATASITFDLAKDLVVDSVMHHGTKLNFEHTTNALHILFGTTLPVGQPDSVAVFYKGVPPNAGFGSFVQSTHSGTPIIWTLSEPYGARDWWPCKDALTDKADSIDINLTYPAGYTASSNGLPIKIEINQGLKREFWKHRYPIATYLVAVAITNYAVDTQQVQLPTGPMPLHLYAYPENLAGFKAATTTAAAALAIYSDLVGPYPFRNERYAQTQFGWGGGMEHQTNSFISAPNPGLVAHELAHQWFGDKVTADSWQDLWLNEGAATYMELLFAEKSGSARMAFLQRWQASITREPGGAVFCLDTLNTGRLFDNRLTYQKGAYVLHMLRGILGDAAFFKGLRAYLTDARLQYKTARTADLQQNLEAASGKALALFFNNWVFGEGYPDYKAEWHASGATSVRLTLSQMPSHASVSFFEMPVPLHLRNATRDTTIIVNHTRNNEVFTLNAGFVPDTILIDPDLWILSKNKIALKMAAPPPATDVRLYPNPAQGILSLYLPPAAQRQMVIRIVNTLGQQVLLRQVTTSDNQVITLPVHQLASGVYWVQVYSEGVPNLVKKLLILK